MTSRASATLFGSSPNDLGWQTAIHAVVHRLGRQFGFQAYNLDPRSETYEKPIWVPATVFLVTDHLHHLLVKNYMRRDKASGTDDERFARCVGRLHIGIFQGYYDWCRHVVLPARIGELQLRSLRTRSPIAEWEYLLEELALYFLVYSEAANLRHLPEGLWFLFWVLRNSRRRILPVSCPPPTDPRSAVYISQNGRFSDVMQKRVSLRNRHQAAITRLRAALSARPDGECRSITESKQLLVAARSAVALEALVPAGSPEEDFLAEMVAWGDSGAFLDKIVSPIFAYLAIHVDKKGSAGVEASARVGYDDCNESLCRRDVVYRVLRELGVVIDVRAGTITAGLDPFDALLRVGQVRVNVVGAVEGTARPASARGASAPPSARKAPGELSWDCGMARDWWDHYVFAKTFVERRSIFSMYRAFFRVWAFLILEFHVMAVLLWWNGNLYAYTSVPLCHALLCLAEQLAGLWTQRASDRGIRVHGGPLSGAHALGFLQWLAVLAVMVLVMMAQISDWWVFGTYTVWWWVAAGYSGLVVAHAVLTTRDGHQISFSHSVAGFFRRWQRSSACLGWFWGLWAWVWELLGASSARPPPRDHLAPYDLHTGWGTHLSNIVFWAVVLGMKLAFDWFAVMRTLQPAILGLYNRGWLRSSDSGHADGDIILCVARCLPAALTMFNDTQIFYYVTVGMFGWLKGLVQLNLGSIATFQELVVTFHKAPSRWWSAGTSSKGIANLAAAVGAACEANAPASSHSATNSSSSTTRSATGSGDPGRARNPNERGQLSHTERLLESTRELVKLQSLEADKARTHLDGDRVTQWLLFSDVWNAVVEDLRDIDLLTNAERDNLVFVHLESDPSIEIVSGMRPFMLPIIFYGGQIQRALERPGVDSGQRVGLSEMRALLCWLLLQIRVLDRPQCDALLEFQPLGAPLDLEHRTSRLRAAALVSELLKTVQRVQAGAPDELGRRSRWEAVQQLRATLGALCGALEVEARAAARGHSRAPRGPGERSAGRLAHGRAQAALRELARLRGDRLEFWGWSAFVGEAGGLEGIYDEAPDSAVKRCVAKVVRQVLRMLETTAKGAQPRGEEAQRVLSFFMGSLKNPTLRRPPLVEDMLSWSTLTPHYEEDVLYALNAQSVARHFGLPQSAARGLADLVSENEDGVSVMQWLRSAYPRDWECLLERLGPQLKGLDPRHVTEADFDTGGPLHAAQSQLLLWASYRGQLLSRTVRGMMSHERALALLARLETPKPPGVSEVAYEAKLKDLVSCKYSYVVASQRYGELRGAPGARARWLARGVDMLLHQYPALRVAFLDRKLVESGTVQHAVLVRANVGTVVTDEHAVQELYRVRLPQNRETEHGVVLGEGKPENQNQAIIFCWGEIIQAIDMNQDNYLCEALKMRSLTSEFNPPRFDDLHAQAAQAVGIGRKESRASDTSEESEPPPPAGKGWEHERPFPDMAHQPVALVGFREWIFSQDSGALAGFAAATEFTFGSIVQRIMTWPGAARFHYGHPDLWNKLFVMTRGGPSKATRGFHISEDVFAGYNHTLRGGRTKFKEYVSVGKGRDMGFDSINGFEAKVSGGNGEQVMSRDVFRMSARMDFFRLMAFYHSGCGFFVNTTLLLASVYANVWVIVLISLTGSELVVDPRTLSVVSSLTGQVVGVSVNQAVQLGLFSIVTYAVELMLERGIMHMLATILVQIIQGSVAFFTFRARTTMHYFMSDVQYGGAKYVSTGRGYALKHNSFVKVYAGYARSHLYFGTELIFMLILLALINTSDYALLTWSAWLVAVCLLWAPFWFNPQTFQIERCTDDFEAWVLWMTDVVDAESGTTWFSWNKGQLERARNELGTLNNPLATTVRGLLMAVPTAVLAVAAVTTINNTEYNRWIIFGTVSGGFWFAVVAIWCLRYVMLRNYWHRLWRATRTFVAIGLIASIVCVIIFIPGGVSAGVGIRNLVIIVFANIEIVAIVAQVLLYTCRGSLKARYITDSAYRMLDWALGYVLFGFLFLLSFLQIVDIMQGALLFNMKFAKALQRSRLLESNFFSSYVDRAMERVTKNLKEEQRLAGEPHSGRPPVSRSPSKVA